jgi:putative Holliday junction resolvase
MPDNSQHITTFAGMSRILAIDFGIKRTGIAVTVPLRIIASGLTTVSTSEVMDFLIKYCKEEEVECFVVGLPMHHDGNPAQIAPQADEFAAQLQKQFPDKPVLRFDERYTSKEASQIILQSGAKKSKRRDKALVDKVAAALILERYMEKNHW